MSCSETFQLNAVCSSPLFSPCRDRDVHRLVPDGTIVGAHEGVWPGPGSPKDSPSAEVDTSLQWCSTGPHGVDGTASGRISLPEQR